MGKPNKLDTLHCRVYDENIKGQFWKEISRSFIELPIFSKRWSEIGLGDDELLDLQIMLLKDPESGPVMEGTGGIRKVRFPLENRGKNEKENLTQEEKNVLKKLVKALKEEAGANWRKNR